MPSLLGGWGCSSALGNHDVTITQDDVGGRDAWYFNSVITSVTVHCLDQGLITVTDGDNTWWVERSAHDNRSLPGPLLPATKVIANPKTGDPIDTFTLTAEKKCGSGYPA